MSSLHLTKVAFGCAHVETFVRRVASRDREGEVRVATRVRPKRQDELIGGYIHWIIRHRIVARQQILRFEDRKDGRLDIVCAAAVELLPPTPYRAHQGWRYLADANAPPTDVDACGANALPLHIHRELMALHLL